MQQSESRSGEKSATEEECDADRGVEVEHVTIEAWRTAIKSIDPVSHQAYDSENASLKYLIDVLAPDRRAALYRQLRSESYAAMSGDERRVLMAMTELLLDHNDFGELVALLSCNPPPEVFWHPLEIAVGLRACVGERRIFLALADSYLEARNADAKQTLLKSLAAAFPRIRKAEPDDDRFVEKCAQWYKDQAGKVIGVNPEYIMLEDDPEKFLPSGPVELFTVKEARAVNLR